MTTENLIITRKFGMEHNLLNKCEKDSASSIHSPDFDMLFSKISIFHILSASLEIVSVPLNPYEITYLKDVFLLYSKRVMTPLFELEDLFKEGWLTKNVDEWTFTASRNKYERLKVVDDGRDSQIIKFIRELVKLPYRDAIGLQMDNHIVMIFLTIEK